jgi:hypothetical protein
MAKTAVFFRQIGYVIIASILLFAYFPNVTSAAPITARVLMIGSSVASASTTYGFTFTVPSSTVIQSVGFAACTTASGACTPVTGFSSSSSTLTSQPSNLGDASGWAVNNANVGELRLNKTGNVTAPTGNQTVSFSNVTNPSNATQTFFMRITTYSDSSWITPIDTGVVAASTAGQVTAIATVDETLDFIISTATVDLGTLSKVSTGLGTSLMTVGTNALNGYSVSYSGPTLASGSNVITAMTTQTGSVMNSKQFGINLVSNTAPSIGSTVTGSGSGTPSTGYDTPNQFKFSTAGDVVATAMGPTNDNVFTTSYIANINSATPPGVYTSIITYAVTANF